MSIAYEGFGVARTGPGINSEHATAEKNEVRYPSSQAMIRPPEMVVFSWLGVVLSADEKNEVSKSGSSITRSYRRS